MTADGPIVLPLLALVGGACALALAALDLRRSPQPGHGWFVAAIVPLVAAAVPFEPFGFDYAAADNAWAWRLPVALVVFLPAVLLHLVAALSGRERNPLVRTCDAMTALLVVWLLVIPRFPGPNNPDLPWWFELAFAVYALQFAIAIVVAVWMLLSAARGATGAARMRGRLLAATLGAFGFAYLIWFASPTPAVDHAMSWASFVTGVLLWLAIRGPRAAWSLIGRRAQDPFQAIEGLVGSPDVRSALHDVVASVATDWGLIGLAVLDADGRPIEIAGETPLRSTAARVARPMEVRATGAGVGMRAWTTPLTPPLRRPDIERLTFLAHLIQLALAREDTARRRHDVERASQDVDQRLLQANEQLRAAAALRDRAARTVAHDLRGPVNALLGLTDALDTRWHELPVDQLEPLQQLVARQVARLAAVVDKLLVVASLEDDTLRSTPELVDIHSLIESIVDEGIDADVRVSGCNTPEPCCHVHAEPLALREIITQLLDNARTHGSPDIEVRLSTARAHIVIEVLDRGTGIRADFEPVLFERFTRDSPKVERGLGLGLAIARELAASLDGTVGYRREHDDRSVFWLRLPAAPAGASID